MNWDTDVKNGLSWSFHDRMVNRLQEGFSLGEN